MPNDMNHLTVWCSGCRRVFRYDVTAEGDFAGWVPCACGQTVPVIETTLGFTPGERRPRTAGRPRGLGWPGAPRGARVD